MSYITNQDVCQKYIFKNMNQCLSFPKDDFVNMWWLWWLLNDFLFQKLEKTKQFPAEIRSELRYKVRRNPFNNYGYHTIW